MKELTIGIASIFPDNLKNCLNSITAFTADIEYEVIICGPKTIEPVVKMFPKTQFLLDTKCEGANPAYQMTLENSRGEYFVALNENDFIYWLALKILLLLKYIVLSGVTE